jgi:hypothetical protein
MYTFQNPQETEYYRGWFVWTRLFFNQCSLIITKKCSTFQFFLFSIFCEGASEIIKHREATLRKW